MKRFGLLWLLVLISSVSSGSLFASDGPLRISNTSPGALIFGVPYALGGELLREAQELSFTTSVSNIFTSNSNGSSFAFFDGETLIMTAAYRRSLGQRFELGLDVPYVIHHGGQLDRLVDEFHDLFGLPQGGRDQAQRNKIDFVIRQDNERYADFQDSREAFGDVRVSGAFQWILEPDRALALRASLKLPTGDAEKLTGSEAADVAVWLELTDRRLLSQLGVNLTLSGGVLLLGEGEVVPHDQNDAALFGHFGLSYQLSERWAFKVQLDGHTDLIDTGLDQVSGAALQGSVGFGFDGRSGFWGEFSLAEDLVSDSSPDVVFQLVLGSRF